MKTARLTQNFCGRRAVIFALAGGSLDVLEQTLRRLGLTTDVRAHQPRTTVELPEDLHPEQAVVLIDGDLILPTAWPEIYGGAELLWPCPTIGLVGTEAPSRLKAMMQLGAMAFVAKPVHSGLVYSALYLAVNEFNRSAMLQASVQDLTDRRRKRIHIIRAVAALMRSRGLDEDAAYDILRKESMCARTSIEDYCRTLMQTKSDCDHDRSATNKRCQAH